MSSSTWSRAAAHLAEVRRMLGAVLSEAGLPPWDGDVHAWLSWFTLDESLDEVDAGQLYMPGRETFEPTMEKKALTDKRRAKLAAAATKASKSGVKVPEHYVKECSMDAFQKNVRYFYKVKSAEWEGTKEENLKRAIAASYSVLKRSCGVKSDTRMTPKEIVAAGGGE